MATVPSLSKYITVKISIVHCVLGPHFTQTAATSTDSDAGSRRKWAVLSVPDTPGALIGTEPMRSMRETSAPLSSRLGHLKPVPISMHLFNAVFSAHAVA